MRRAVEAGRQRFGLTTPNPAVGCCLVRRGVLVAEGWHERAGAAHAEVHALSRLDAPELARGATAYVTLEPCNHTGRTGPCTEALIAAGVERVVIGLLDPNPQVAGGGVERLRAAGIRVDVGVESEACADLVRPFVRAVTLGLPDVELKLASTLDGRVARAGGGPTPITGAAARNAVAELRERADVVMVGVGTVLADNPRLTARPAGRPPLQQPAAVVVDSQLRTPPTSAVVRPGTWVFAAPGADVCRRRALEDAGVRVEEVECGPAGLDMEAVLRRLVSSAAVHRVFVEGGPRLASSLLADALVCRVRWFVAPSLLGAGVSALDVREWSAAAPSVLQSVRWEAVGEDMLCTGVPANARA